MSYTERDNLIYLCNTKLDNNSNQIVFSSVQEQESYFKNSARLKYTLSDVTYVREPNDKESKDYIIVDIPIEDLQAVNYVMYKNSNEPTSKFAFVDRITWNNDRSSIIYLIEDYFQNNLFSMKFLNSYVERETEENTSIYNTLADDVAHGQLVEKAKFYYQPKGCYFVFCSSGVTKDDTTEEYPYSLNIGSYNIPCWVLYFKENEYADMGKIIQNISNKGRGDRIISVVYMPCMGNLDLITFVQRTGDDIGDFKVATSIPRTALQENISVPFSQYLTGDKKQYTYPYAKLCVTDMCTGQRQEYAIDKLSLNSDGNFTFQMLSEISDTPFARFTPVSYQGEEKAVENSLVIRYNSQLPHANNSYAKYMMMNNESNIVSMLSSITGGSMGIIGGVASGNPLATISGGVSILEGIASKTVKENQASKLNNTVSSITDGACSRIIHDNRIKFSLMTMDDSHKNMALSYWKRFGYPQRKIKTINLMPSGSYKFLQIAEPNIYGNVDTLSKQELVDMFKRGITLWKSDIGNY